jgi:hypothetical protein
MSEVSFEDAAVQQTEPVFDRNAGAVAVPDDYDDSGGFTSADAKPGRLKVVMALGDVASEHPEWIGQFVYDGATPLSKQVELIFLHVQKVYQEDKVFDGVPPIRWRSQAEAVASGKAFREAALTLVLIKSDKVTASREIAGEMYVPAYFDLTAKTWYSFVGRKLLPDKDAALGGKWYGGTYTIGTKSIKNPRGGSNMIVWDFKGFKKNSPELLEAILAKK